MSPGLWRRTSEEGDDQTSLERQSPSLVSLHFIRTALRRRLLVCVLSPVLGLLLAAVFMTAFPPAHAAKAALVLEYDPQTDPEQAMATNISLLKTQTLATRTVRSLGLTMAPDDFLKTLTIEPVGSELLSLTLAAPDDAEATRRLTALTTVYLEFRSEQLSYQAKVLVDGLEGRIQQLQVDVRSLSTQIEKLSLTPTSDTSKLSDAIAQRAYIQGRVETLEQSREDVTLRTSAVVSASRVLDPPVPEPGLATRTFVLGLASGLIGGTGLGCGTVLFRAITSDKLRRRSDVATALQTDVRLSVGHIAPHRRIWAWLPPVWALDRRRAQERRRVAQAIEEEVLSPGHRGRLAVAGVDNTGEVGFAVADAASSLAARGYPTTVIDLTRRGSRGLRGAFESSGSDDSPTVLRTKGVPALARHPDDLLPFGQWDEGDDTASPQLSDVTLILAELDPAVGASHLSAWTDQVLLVLTAGRTSVEKARTIGDQIRDAGLELRFSLLLGTERTDNSSGSAHLGQPLPRPRPEGEGGAEQLGRLEVR